MLQSFYWLLLDEKKGEEKIVITSPKNLVKLLVSQRHLLLHL